MFTIRYSLTYNWGNFESERIEVEDEFDPTKHTYDQAIVYLRSAVQRLRRLPADPTPRDEDDGDDLPF